MRFACIVAFVLAALGCHHGKDDAKADVPSSCVIEHDGGVTQCFEEIGPVAKKDGAKLCNEMHGEHAFHPGQPCPTDGVVASCVKRGGTDLERIERCYRDETACGTRCAKSGGTFRK